MSLKDRWSSNLAFFLVATGAAVGLGSIWKFPYEVGRQGGGAFVCLYLLFVLLLGIPLMLAEVSLGLLGRQDPVGTLQVLAKRFHANPLWPWLGRMSLMTLLCILSFYSVVGGWDIEYLTKSLFDPGALSSVPNIQHVWDALMASPAKLVIFHSIFLGLTGYVVMWPIQAGIERASKVMMPLLLFILILLDVYGLYLPGANKAAAYLFSVRWEEVNIDVIESALGNAMFTLAVGAGCMLVYGAYVPKSTRVVPMVITIALFDALVALMSGFAIFSIVFSYDLVPTAGPGLMFISLPIAFKSLYMGHVIGLAFFVLLLFAAWTSSISLLEPLVAYGQSYCGWSRFKSVLAGGLLAWLLGLLSAFSFNLLADWSVMGKGNFFEWISYITTNCLLVLGGFGYAIFVGWCVPVDKLKNALTVNHQVFFLWYRVVRYILPILMLGLLVRGGL